LKKGRQEAAHGQRQELAETSHSAVHRIAAIESRHPGAMAGAAAVGCSDLGLLGDLEGIIHLDAQHCVSAALESALTWASIQSRHVRANPG
jgi:hypothetical protein